MPSNSSRTSERSKPATKSSRVVISCPSCGHKQEESASAYSTTCKSCRQYIRVQEALRPAATKAEPENKGRSVVCFDCGTKLDVSPSAQSTMCKRCSCHIDLADHKVLQSMSKNFRTKGTMVVEETGYLFNSETTASHIILKGRFIGKLKAEEILEIHPKAKIKGTIQAGLLVIPAETHFTWPDPIQADAADIAGELVGPLRCRETVRLKASARMFGDVEAGQLVVEDGAVFVGRAKVGVKPKAGKA